MRFLILALLLSSCQITVKMLPKPENTKIQKEQERVLRVLVDDYNKRIKK